MSGLSFERIADAWNLIEDAAERVLSMTPSTPIAECKDVTADERKAIAARTPPYDGVRTWGDLEAVRAQTKPAKERAE
jgi:hypothetical protein